MSMRRPLHLLAVLLAAAAVTACHRRPVGCELVFRLATPGDPAALDRAIAGVRDQLDQRGVQATVARDGDTLVVGFDAALAGDADRISKTVTRVAPTELARIDTTRAACPLVEVAATDPRAQALGIEARESLESSGRECALVAVDGKAPRTSGRDVLERYLAELATRDGAPRLPADRALRIESVRRRGEPPEWHTRTVEVPSLATGEWQHAGEIGLERDQQRVTVTVTLDPSVTSSLAAAFAGRPLRVAVLDGDQVRWAGSAVLTGGDTHLHFTVGTLAPEGKMAADDLHGVLALSEVPPLVETARHLPAPPAR
jgi:hypothetical protein